MQRIRSETIYSVETMLIVSQKENHFLMITKKLTGVGKDHKLWPAEDLSYVIWTDGTYITSGEHTQSYITGIVSCLSMCFTFLTNDEVNIGETYHDVCVIDKKTTGNG